MYKFINIFSFSEKVLYKMNPEDSTASTSSSVPMPGALGTSPQALVVAVDAGLGTSGIVGIPVSGVALPADPATPGAGGDVVGSPAARVQRSRKTTPHNRQRSDQTGRKKGRSTLIGYQRKRDPTYYSKSGKISKSKLTSKKHIQRHDSHQPPLHMSTACNFLGVFFTQFVANKTELFYLFSVLEANEKRKLTIRDKHLNKKALEDETRLKAAQKAGRDVSRSKKATKSAEIELKRAPDSAMVSTLKYYLFVVRL